MLLDMNTIEYDVGKQKMKSCQSQEKERTIDHLLRSQKANTEKITEFYFSPIGAKMLIRWQSRG